MRLIPVFISLLFISFSSYSVEFYKCVDEKGQIQYSNIKGPKQGTQCIKNEDYYSILLNQDYQNLSNEFKKYEPQSDAEPDFGDTDLNLNSKPMPGNINPDKALDALVDNSRKQPENTTTNSLKSPANAIEVEKPPPIQPDNN